MTAKNRAALIGKLHTSLKKHFKPAPPSPGRPLLEHVLYASLLEDTPTDLADEGFAKCEQEFFDWNEVRVTTVTELAEVLSRLPNPVAAAVRLKKNLQSLFETFYNFDLDFLKKENLGKAVAKFETMPGISPFVLNYLIQHGLGGHAIPVDKASMKLMWLCGIVSNTEAESGKVPGLERTIPKNRSLEFSSLLHQAGVAFQANNKDKAVWDILLSVNKDAKALFDLPTAPTSAPPKPKRESEPTEAAPAKTGGSKLTKTSKSEPAAAGATTPKPAGATAKATAAKPSESKSADSKSSESKTSDVKAGDAKKVKDKSKDVAPAKPAEKLSGKSTKSPAAKPTEPEATEAKSQDAKSVKPKESAAKPTAGKDRATPADAKSLSKKAPAKPATKAAEPTTKVPASGKSSSPAGKDAGSKDSAKPASKKSPAKPAEGAKSSASVKPLSTKASGNKAGGDKAAADKGGEKPASKKSDAKPASRKGGEAKPEAGKEVPSANKKLTKQKPR